MTASTRFLLATLLLVASTAPSLRAQDTLSLAAMHRLAESADARSAQRQLLADQSALRSESLRRERLPSLGATASGTYLSDVPSLPGGALGPMQQQYDSYITARTTLFDPSRGARAGVESAQLAEAQASVHSALWQVRTQVNDAYFGILQRQAQRRVLEAAITDLEERRRVARARVEGGAALASEALLLDAELTRRAQLLIETRADEDALRAMLSSLVGRAVTPLSVLQNSELATLPLPELGGDRPEFAQYASSRQVLAQREAVISAQQKPRVALVGRGGYGRPGLNALGREFDTYYTMGLQLEWTPFNWGSTSREREVQRLQVRMVDSNEASFREALSRYASAERTRIGALAAGLGSDSTIIALREQVLAETRLRFDEGEVSAADYVLRLTDALTARLERETRTIRLAEARARYLTTLGQEVR